MTEIIDKYEKSTDDVRTEMFNKYKEKIEKEIKLDEKNNYKIFIHCGARNYDDDKYEIDFRDHGFKDLVNMLKCYKEKKKEQLEETKQRADVLEKTITKETAGQKTTVNPLEVPGKIREFKGDIDRTKKDVEATKKFLTQATRGEGTVGNVTAFGLVLFFIVAIVTFGIIVTVSGALFAVSLVLHEHPNVKGLPRILLICYATSMSWVYVAYYYIRMAMTKKT